MRAVPIPFRRASEPAVRSLCSTARKEGMQFPPRPKRPHRSDTPRRLEYLMQHRGPGRQSAWLDVLETLAREVGGQSLSVCRKNTSTRTRQLLLSTDCHSVTTSPLSLLDASTWASQSICRRSRDRSNYPWALNGASRALDSEKPPECLAAKGGYSIDVEGTGSTRRSSSELPTRRLPSVLSTVATFHDSETHNPVTACRCACLPIAEDLQ